VSILLGIFIAPSTGDESTLYENFIQHYVVVKRICHRTTEARYFGWRYCNEWYWQGNICPGFTSESGTCHCQLL